MRPTQTARAIGSAGFLLSAALLFVIAFHASASGRRFDYDEADYMTAARMGFLENYVETSSMSFITYVELGLRSFADHMSQSDLSEYIRSKGDLSFYRHYHGPLYFHWLIMIGRLSHTESAQRK